MTFKVPHLIVFLRIGHGGLGVKREALFQVGLNNHILVRMKVVFDI